MELSNLFDPENEKTIKKAIETSEVYFPDNILLEIGKDIGSFISEAVDFLVDSVIPKEEE